MTRVLSPARGQLLDVLQKTRAGEVALRCHVHVRTVRCWARGDRVPGEREQRALADTYGIDARGWTVKGG